MGNAAGGMEVPLSKEGKAATLPTGSTGSQKPPAGLKLPMPPEDELEERFNAVLVSWCWCWNPALMSPFTQSRRLHNT